MVACCSKYTRALYFENVGSEGVLCRLRWARKGSWRRKSVGNGLDPAQTLLDPL